MQKYVGRIEFSDGHIMNGLISSSSMPASPIRKAKNVDYNKLRDEQHPPSSILYVGWWLCRLIAKDLWTRPTISTGLGTRLSSLPRHLPISLEGSRSCIPISCSHSSPVTLSLLTSWSKLDYSIYWVWLNELRGLSLKAKRKLLQNLGNPKEIYQTSMECVTEVLPNSSRNVSAVAERPKELPYVSALEKENLEYTVSVLRNNKKQTIHILCANDLHYRTEN